MDHLLPLYVREAGGLVVYVPDAVATDRPISGLREAAPQPDPDGDAGHPREPVDGRGVGAVATARSGRGDLVAQAAALGDAVVRRRRGRRRASSSASAGQPVYLVRRWRSRRSRTAAAGHLLIGAGRHPWRAVTFVRSFAVVNIAFATGWLNVIRGREIEVLAPERSGTRRRTKSGDRWGNISPNQ
jgi:hypothetical protein